MESVLTLLVILLIPLRITGYVLWRLSLLLPLSIEHLLEKLKLRICDGEEEEGGGEE